MTAAQQTLTTEQIQHQIFRVAFTKKVNAADWVFLADTGAFNPTCSNITGALDTFAYGTAAAAANSTTGTAVASATGNKLNVTSANTNRIAGQPFYLFDNNTGEMMLVIGDSAPTNATSTFTVIRGCLGTTASASLSASDTLYIMNCLVLVTGTGYETITYIPMPSEPKAVILA
jgi:hypothetical protein